MTDSPANPTSSNATRNRIDWAAVHKNLEIARAPLEQGWQPSADKRKQILKARAEELARTPEIEEAGSETLEVIEFLLAKERYAIECTYVREIFPLKEITPLPCAPPFIAGIINVRGRIVSVVSLKTLFDLPQKLLTNLNRVIIIHKDRMEFGLLVDAVLHDRISIGHIQPVLPGFAGLLAKFSRGVTADSLVVLKAEEILGEESLIKLGAEND